jgi:hypothetical protein
LTCVQIIAQAEENVRLITTATLLSVNVQKTGKVKRVTFLTVQTTVVFLIKASAIQVMSEDAPASQSGRVLDVQFLCQLISPFGLERNILT